MITNKLGCLSGNLLKVIGCITMFIDHLGFLVFPNLIILRVIGRLSYPIFAYLLAEGCFYTKNRTKHFLTIFVFGVLFQVVYYIVMKRIDLSIFLIFSISILFVYLFDYIVKLYKEKKSFIASILLIGLISLSLLVHYLDYRYYYFEYSYGFMGIMVPFLFYVFRRYVTQNNFILVLIFLLLLILIPILGNSENIFMCMSIPLLLLYNGKKGKWNLKYFFYAFYPLHIVIVYILYLII